MLRPATYQALCTEAGGLEILSFIRPELLSDLSQELIRLGAKIVALKMGNRGLYLRTAGWRDLEEDGTPRLVGTYVKIKPPMEAYESGLCVWNEERQAFDQHRVLWTKSEAKPKQPLVPDGHPAFWKDAQGKEWLLFGNPLPTFRCAATFEAWQDSSQWEALRPQAELTSAADGTPVKTHSGHIAWNAWRKRWVTVFMQAFGKPSAFGELWYAEADAPSGPWGKAVKVLSHDNYTFYNPRLHPEFTPADSPTWLLPRTPARLQQE